MTATETALAAFGVLAIHSVAYYVWVAVAAPRYVPHHEPLPAFTVQESTK